MLLERLLNQLRSASSVLPIRTVACQYSLLALAIGAQTQESQWQDTEVALRLSIRFLVGLVGFAQDSARCIRDVVDP